MQQLVPTAPANQPTPTPVNPSPVSDATARDRFELLAITRRVNGIVSAQVRDKLAGTTNELFEYDKHRDFILTKIDVTTNTLTFVDANMRTATISNPNARRVEAHGK